MLASSIYRLERVIFEIERLSTPVAVVADVSVLRCLMGYFLDFNPEDIPFYDVPSQTVIKITPQAYGTLQEFIPLPSFSEGISTVNSPALSPKVDAGGVDATSLYAESTNVRSARATPQSTPVLGALTVPTSGRRFVTPPGSNNGKYHSQGGILDLGAAGYTASPAHELLMPLDGAATAANAMP